LSLMRLLDALTLLLSYLVATPLFNPVRPYLWIGLVTSLVAAAVSIAVYVKVPQQKRCLKLRTSVIEETSQCVILSGLMVRVLLKILLTTTLVFLIMYTGSLYVLAASEAAYFLFLSRVRLSEVVTLDEVCCIGGKLYAESCDVRGRVVKLYRRALVAVTPVSKMTFVIPAEKVQEVHSFIARECYRDRLRAAALRYADSTAD